MLLYQILCVDCCYVIIILLFCLQSQLWKCSHQIDSWIYIYMFCMVCNPSLCIQLHSQQPDQQKRLLIIVKLLHAACTKFAPHLAIVTSPPPLPSLHKMYRSCQTMLYLHITHTILWFVFCCCPQVGLFIGYTAICYVLLWLAGSCNIRTAPWRWWCLGVETSCSYNKWISVNKYCVYLLVKYNRSLQDCAYTSVW
jgi:hypothetical protein